MARVWQKYTKAGIVLFLLMLCLYYLRESYTNTVSRSTESSNPTTEKDASRSSAPQHVQHIPINVREPEHYSADDHPELQYLRKYGHVSAIPGKDELKTMSKKQLFYLYHSYLDNLDFLCHRKLRMGHAGDGGWEVCDDYKYRPIKPCVVYSFGINNDFSFDDDVARLYGCDVYAFDPSMNKSTHRRSERVRFYNLGVGGTGGKLPTHSADWAVQHHWKVRSFSAIRKMLKHAQTPIDIVKMDIEHSEWLTLAAMAEEGQLTQVRQLMLEVHDFRSTTDDIRRKLLTLAMLEGRGFRRFFSRMNVGCGRQRNGYYPDTRANCYEVYFLNSRFARRRSP